MLYEQVRTTRASDADMCYELATEQVLARVKARVHRQLSQEGCASATLSGPAPGPYIAPTPTHASPNTNP